VIDDPVGFLGNLMLLLVGGNDTTRNSITASVYPLNEFPREYEKITANPALIPNFVSEVIRWQSPIANMRGGSGSGQRQVRQGSFAAGLRLDAHELEIAASSARWCLLEQRRRKSTEEFLSWTNTGCDLLQYINQANRPSRGAPPPASSCGRLTCQALASQLKDPVPLKLTRVQVTLLQAKLHRVSVTGADLNCEGS
jgi:hypothetical protein